MEAPEKIWINSIRDLPCSLVNNNSIEYTRTDAFIEKACDAYCKVCGHFAHTVPTHICRHDCRYFSDFEKYMKGE